MSDLTKSAEGRIAALRRTTAETDVDLSLNLDGSGKTDIATGVGFLDHMLTLLAVHGNFDLMVHCTGDTQVDDHHTVEDIGIALGKAFAQAIGNKAGIARYGFMILPMDEACVMSEAAFDTAPQLAAEAGPDEAAVVAAVDISGRDLLSYNLAIPTQKVGTFDTELVEEFWQGFVRTAACAVHIRTLAGTNAHHIIEGAFKSAARSLRDAVRIDPEFADEIPSTKGVL